MVLRCLVSALLICLSGCSQAPNSSTESDRPGPGSMAPDFLLRSTLGAGVHLAGPQGYAALVSFLSTQSGISLVKADRSRSQIVFLKGMKDRYNANGLRILIVDASAVDSGHDPEPSSLINFTYDWELEDIPVLRDDRRSAAKAYDVKRLPTTLAIDPDGRITARWDGLVTAAGLEFALKPLLVKR